jgi:phage replication O-like protein O
MTPPSPQAENGHIDIANELAEAFYDLQLSGCQWRLLWVILRQTYGWKKKEDRISITFFEKKTGLDRWKIHRDLKNLVKRKIVVKNDNGFISSYGIQKDYSKWARKTIDEIVNSPLTKTSMKPLTKSSPTKETKETIKRKDNFSPSKKELEAFLKIKADEIYEVYPGKANRKNSLRSIEKLLLSYPAELGVCPFPGLKAAVENYRHQVEADGTPPKFIIKSHNFFGEAERWREFIATTRSEPESPFARHYT